MRYLYTFLFYLALPFVYLRLWRRGKRLPAYRERWSERRARLEIPRQFRQGIWVHAVSFGEVNVATPLIKALLAAYPHLPLTITNMTPTGSVRVKQLFGEQVFNCYLPYDLPHYVNSFLSQLQPRLAIFIETELWPNYLHYLKQRAIPSLLANARMSEKSFQSYRRATGMMKTMLNELSFIAVNSQMDAERFLQLAADKAKLEVIGNIKFDVPIPDDIFEKAALLGKKLGEQRLVWVAASTHEGEEIQILNAMHIIQQSVPEALLLLVPRHPDRFKEVEALCHAEKLKVVTRSSQENCDQDTAVFLGDSMGEMFLFFAACDIAFVGGSLIERGGHNTLEPALFSKPVISGPSTFNFSEVTRLLNENRALTTINNADELAKTVIMLMQNKAHSDELGARAQQVVEKNRGALDKHLVLVKHLLNQSK